MIVISDSPYPLIKYHVTKNNIEDRKLIFLQTKSVKDITDCLLESVSYLDNGDLVLNTFIILYEGSNNLPINIKQGKNNITYIVFTNKDLYKNHTNNEQLNCLELSPLQYQHEISFMSALFETKAWDYYWSEYCVKKFQSNPVKWYNESKHLLFLFSEKGNKKFSISDIDILYGKITNHSTNYLFNMFGPNSKEWLTLLNEQELFLLFIKGQNYKSEIEKSIEKYKPDILESYFFFKDSFLKGRLRLKDSVIILDYVIHNFDLFTRNQIYNLFYLH